MNATTPAAGEQSEDDSEDIETKIADLARRRGIESTAAPASARRASGAVRGAFGAPTAIGSLGCSPERSCSLSCSILQHPMA